MQWYHLSQKNPISCDGKDTYGVNFDSLRQHINDLQQIELERRNHGAVPGGAARTKPPPSSRNVATFGRMRHLRNKGARHVNTYYGRRRVTRELCRPIPPWMGRSENANNC